MADDEEELDRLRDELEGMQDVSWSKSLSPRSSSTNSDALMSAMQFGLGLRKQNRYTDRLVRK